MDYNPIFAALNPIFAAFNCFLVCYNLPFRLGPLTASNETALPQQSNERAEKAFDCIPIAVHFSLHEGILAHASREENGNSFKCDKYKFIFTEIFVLKYRQPSSVIRVENTVGRKNGHFYCFPDHDRIMITDHDQRKKSWSKEQPLNTAGSKWLNSQF